MGRLFLHNRLLREDSALSILRSFKPQELTNLAYQAGLNDVRIERRFPYRQVLSARANWMDHTAPGGKETTNAPLTAMPITLTENVGVAR